jgi:hypothetical protein
MPMTSANVPVGGHYAESLETLRSTVKWLVASAGAVAAAIIAGAQLVDYSNRSLCGAVLAATAVAVALTATLLLLARAARILTVPRPTATDLANAEITAGALDEKRRATGQIGDSKVEWLLANTTYLLAGHSTVSDLLAAYSGAQADAATNPSDDGARRRVVELQHQISTVEEAAHYRDTSESYSGLMREFTPGAIAFIIAVLVFAISGLFVKPTPDRPTNPVTEPIPVEVVDLSPSPGTPTECATRDGVAIGGTLTTPTVALAPVGHCPAETVVGGKPNLVVIPRIPPEQPSS